MKLSKFDVSMYWFCSRTCPTLHPCPCQNLLKLPLLVEVGHVDYVYHCVCKVCMLLLYHLLFFAVVAPVLLYEGRFLATHVQYALQLLIVGTVAMLSRASTNVAVHATHAVSRR